MDDIALKVSDIIVAYGSSYRVICIQKDFCVLCQMGSTSLDLKCMQTQDILTGLVDGNVRIENSDELHVADIDSMDVKTKEKFIKRRDFIRDVAQAYGPTFLNLSGRDPKDELSVLIKKYSINRCSAWRYIKAYLQSGLDEYALLPKKTGPQTTAPYQYQNKPGRKYPDTNTGILVDQNVQAYFAEALDYYKSGRANSIRNAFDLMNLLHFTKTEVDVAQYNFSNDMQKFHWGVQAGGEYKIYTHLAVFANLQWGMNGIFPKGYSCVPFALKPIYATLGFNYIF